MVKIPSDVGEEPRKNPVLNEQADSQDIDLEQDLWRQFAEASTLKAFCQSWLSLQCHMLKGIRSGLVLLGTPDHGPFTPAAVWPSPNFSVKHLTGAAERSLRERRGLFIKNDSTRSSGIVGLDTLA